MLSLRAYAAHRKSKGLSGGSLNAVQKAVMAGRIQLVNGKVDPAQADEAWRGNTNPIRQASGNSASYLKQQSRPAPIDDAALVDPQDTPPGSAAAATPNPLMEVRLEREKFNLRREKQEFFEQRKRLVDGRKVKAEMVERAAAERQAVLNIPKRWSSALANGLGADERNVFQLLTKLTREFLTERSTVPVEEDSAAAA